MFSSNGPILVCNGVGENRDMKVLVLPVQKLGMLAELTKDESCIHLVATRSDNVPFFSPIFLNCISVFGY